MSVIAGGAASVVAARVGYALLLAAAIAAASFAAGWSVRGWREAKTDLKTVQQEAAATAQENQRRRAIALRHATDQQRIEDFYDRLPLWWPRVVAERPGLADCELGPDGLRAWNEWNAGPRGD